MRAGGLPMTHVINNVLIGLNNIGSVFCDYAAGVFVQSALLVILLLVVELLLRKRVRAVFRYCLWMLVLVKLVLPPMLSLPTGIGYWVGGHLPAASSISDRAFDVARLERTSPSGEMPQVRPARDIAENEPSIMLADSALTPLTWQAILFVLWLVGVLAFLVVLVQRVRFVRGLIAVSRPAKEELLGLLEQCRQQIGVRWDIRLRVSDTIPSPAVCGLLRPTVLIPAPLVEKLSPEALRATLIHELAHIKRGDLWVNSVQTFLQVIYFYNPFVWFAPAVIRRVCEEAVDEMVLVTLGGQAKDYSNTLIDIGEMAFWRADLGLRLIGVAESKKALQWRIRHMLNRPIPKSSKLGALGIIIIFTIAAVLLPMAKAKKSTEDNNPVATENERKSTKLLHQAAADGDIEQVKSLISKGGDVNAKSGKGWPYPAAWSVFYDQSQKPEEGWTPLHTAAWYGRKDVAEVLITKGANVNDTDVSGQTPLHLAANYGSRDLTELLIAKGANVNDGDDMGNTALHHAAGFWNVKKGLLELLIEKGAEVNARNDKGQTPLHLAAPSTNNPKKPSDIAANVLLTHGAFVNAKDKGGRTPLYMAAGNGKIKVVELLLAKGALIDHKTNEEMTALHRAVMGQPYSKDVVEVLLNQGADANATQWNGWTALHYAARGGNYEARRGNYAARAGNNDIVELLISKGADVNAKNVRGETPAHLAIVQIRKDTVKLLISKGAEISTIQLAAYIGDLAKVKSFIEKGISINAQDGYWLTPLHAAAATGQRDVVEFLINKGASVNAAAVAEGPGTPLHYAIDGGSKEIAELLVIKGARVNETNKYSQTPLHLVARGGYKGLVKLLLARGAYVNAKGQIGRTPLHYAARFGHKDVAALLIDNGADVKAEIDHKLKYTPFWYAARFGHKDVAELLIDKGDDVKVLPPFLLHSVCSGGHRDLAELLIKKGANVNSEAWDDAPSLYAVWNDHPDVLELLLSYGANPDEKDRKDWSLLHYAAGSGSTDMTRLLLDKGADPNVKTNGGLQTPLHISVVAGNKEIAELLISHGADLNTKRYDGRTPLSLAKEKAHSEIVELLRKHGAKE